MYGITVDRPGVAAAPRAAGVEEDPASVRRPQRDRVALSDVDHVQAPYDVLVRDGAIGSQTRINARRPPRRSRAASSLRDAHGDDHRRGHHTGHDRGEQRRRRP